MQIRGLAVAVKPKNGRQNASVTRVMNVTVGSHQRRGFTLTPGINDKWRHTTVLGESIGDVPTRYTITGLEAHELPVIGEWVNHTNLTQRTLPPQYRSCEPLYCSLKVHHIIQKSLSTGSVLQQFNSHFHNLKYPF